MFIYIWSMTAIFSKSTYLYLVESVRKFIVGYANARKRAHISVTLLTWCVEIAAIMLVHEVAMHLFLSSAVMAWETAVITIGEDI